MKGEPLRLPTPYAFANEQIQRTIESSRIPSGTYPHLPWTSVHAVIGPLLPGMLVVVGARPNQGKTSFLAMLFSHLFRAGVASLYCISGDGGPTRLRKILAAMHCGFRRTAVLRNQWAEAAPPLSEADALVRFHEDLAQQEAWADCGMIADVPVLTRAAMRSALRVGLGNGARIVIVDHVNRWTPGQARNTTEDLADAVRALANVAAQKGVTVILAAQVTPWAKESRNVLTEFACPPVSALKQTQALVEEPHAILMLHRARRPDVTAEELRLAALGQRQARDLIEPGVMCVTVGKHRDDDTVGSTVRLRIDSTGWIADAGSLPSSIPPREREPGEENERLPF